MVPVAFRVKVVAAPFVGAIDAPAATVKSPLTSMVTFDVANALEMALAVEALMVIPSGSKSQLPALPNLAVTSTTVDLRISRIPDELVSTKPPLPPKAPPWALKVPATTVLMLDQMLISPPLPFCVDEASTVAPASTVVVLAWFSALTSVRLPSRCCVKVTLVVPTLIRPPFAIPRALVFDPSAKVMSSPCKVILPPSAFEPLPLALIVPA